MRLAIAASETQKDEWMSTHAALHGEISWYSSAEAFIHAEADAFFDLLFFPDPIRINLLKTLLPKPVIIHSVTETLNQTDAAFIRINAWPGFLARKTWEMAVADLQKRDIVQKIFEPSGITCAFVPDITGMVTPRIIASLVNEAYFTLEAGTATKEEIDLAMKLGTNYPMGPFTWAKKIGLQNIYALLTAMEKENKMYAPCSLLKKETE